MKILFMGTPDFAVPVLEALIAAGHEIVLAVTQPDKPAGRKGTPVPPPVKSCALAHGIPVFQPERVRRPEAMEELKKVQADLGVVVAFGKASIQLRMPAMGGVAPQVVDALVAHVLVEKGSCCLAFDGSEVSPHVLEGRAHDILAVSFP